MPYVLISTQIRLECGPTICGDEKSDQGLMAYLGATLTQQIGNNFSEYRSDHPPRIVLDLLESKGYTLVSQCGVGQTVIWTLCKPSPPGQNGLQR
ncbi:GTP cyclohydrolase 1 feedback regulatory protein-like [Apostichopus japonicus]|uniref:GTP cyclohydrolase 1 feedback regulatory protein-like n=1 Tax=Stichopus japonicus TaxID=307972 RepID=UPI003AB7E0BC